MNSLLKVFVVTLRQPLVTTTRGRKPWLLPYLFSLYKRRLEQGPEPERPRSQWINWNYKGELYCFGKRLSEDFNLDILQRAFITSEYVELETEKRKNILLDDSQFKFESQEELVVDGNILLNKILLRLISNSYPLLPPDGHQSILEHLTSAEVLFHVGSNLGLKDLVLYPTHPIPSHIISDTFKAVISTLDKSDTTRTENFVRDFVLVEMTGKEVEDVWHISDPMGWLADVLIKKNMAPPEPRLLWATGESTIMACFMVGIYSDKKFIGKGAGETVIIAEEMAARDCLNRIYGVTFKKDPLSYSNSKTLQNFNSAREARTAS